jgi:hypothetical protein
MENKSVYKRFITIVVIILLPFLMRGQNAPVTTAGSSQTCPNGVVNVPLNVSDFNQIASLTLRLDFNPNYLTYNGCSNINPSLSGIFINEVIVSSTLHKIMMVWSSMNPVTLTNGSKLTDLSFTSLNESSEIIFNNTANGGSDCEYSDVNMTPLNDIPTSSYYINSVITNLGAGTAGTISGSETVCRGQTGVAYSVPPINNATGYVWELPAGATIATGLNTHAITVDFSNTAVSGNISVYGTNSCGNGTASSDFAVTVNPCGVSINGMVSYPNNSNTPLSNVTINLKNGDDSVVGTTITNASGIYSFSGVIPGNYSLNAVTVKPWGGVTATDVLLYSKHIVNIAHLSGIYLASGDVNLSGSLTATDLLLIKKRIATLINAFPSGNWLFDVSPFTVGIENVIQNFNGIIYGDANGSYIPAK